MDEVPVYFVSDHTGVTAEVLGRSLLARFEGLVLRTSTRPFVDSQARAAALAREFETLPQPPIVFSTISEASVRERLTASAGVHLDLFAPFLPPLEERLRRTAQRRVGASHGIRDLSRYQARIDAVEFALATDDGSNPNRYGQSHVVAVGASRVGKSPTCLYLAMQYGVLAANLPLVDEDFERSELPPQLRPHRDRLFGLTIAPQRLHELREKRRPGSRYASLERCQYEVRAARRLFEAHAIPYQETTTLSVEELAAVILQRMGLERQW